MHLIADNLFTEQRSAYSIVCSHSVWESQLDGRHGCTACLVEIVHNLVCIYHWDTFLPKQIGNSALAHA